MELTTKKLKQMIREELNKLNEDWDHKDVGLALAATPAIVLAGLGIYDIADQSMLDREQLIQDVQMLSVEEIQQNLENSEYFKNLNARRMRKKAAQNKSGFYDEFGIDHTQSSRPGDDESFQIEVQSKEMAEKIKNLSPEELDQLLNIRALQNVLRYDMPKPDSAPLSINHSGPFKESKDRMKLTSQKLKQMIRESLGESMGLPIRKISYDDLQGLDRLQDTIDLVRQSGFDVGDSEGLYSDKSHHITTPIIYIVARGQAPTYSTKLGQIDKKGDIELSRNGANNMELKQLQASVNTSFQDY